MRKPRSQTVMATYRTPKANATRLLKALKSHRRTLDALGLVTATPMLILRREERGGPVLYEIFDWISAAAVENAHRAPAVMKAWDSIGRLCRARGAKPAMEFPHVARCTA